MRMVRKIKEAKDARLDEGGWSKVDVSKWEERRLGGGMRQHDHLMAG